ncbi:L-threonylcarbamoyladenylate synthase [Pseudarthrobacter sulfonivorans]|uniref:L-threonylcarbamoyladenylate synthase n=1 Tax=Pseudarthrobacter sulfonivorans TaxID=121292 RepID=UPI00285A6686|nr:L-threonylcarbamoyladenylate synthase [Pseudarthrobacter sulfonivorans]MDR6413919.1 tRNA threonylcarbamoyl adenosine modification protein (Sua5/YciO/YrdC/YwlC family) [Pseudarthrobacter sulfonivorans]
MTTTYNCTSEDQRALGLEHAQRAISEKKCVVFPTDTVYGIAADAFSPQAVTMLLVSKGRSRAMPPPVLIPRINALDGLATDISADARKLAEAFWPGGLTLILHAQLSLDWDLGDTQGTVALRMPADEVAQELLTLTGPLAVSSANRTGQAPAQTAAEARAQLADSVEVYLEGGFRPLEGTAAVPSTIVDATGPILRVVRNGAVSLDQLREHVPGVLGLGEIPLAEPEDTAPEDTLPEGAPLGDDAGQDSKDAAPAGESVESGDAGEPAATASDDAGEGTPDVRKPAAPAEKDPEA